MIDEMLRVIRPVLLLHGFPELSEEERAAIDAVGDFYITHCFTMGKFSLWVQKAIPELDNKTPLQLFQAGKAQ